MGLVCVVQLLSRYLLVEAAETFISFFQFTELALALQLPLIGKLQNATVDTLGGTVAQSLPTSRRQHISWC